MQSFLIILFGCKDDHKNSPISVNVCGCLLSQIERIQDKGMEHGVGGGFIGELTPL